MNPDLLKLLAECEAAEGKATPGPWRLDAPIDMFVFGPDMEMVASEGPNGEMLLRGVGRGLPMDQNAALICLFRTALPQLVRTIREMAKAGSMLREAAIDGTHEERESSIAAWDAVGEGK